MKKSRLPFFACLGFALLYAGPGLLPGRTLLPLDLLEDLGAWKADPAERRPVSNSLLSDPLVAFLPWDAEVSRLLAAGEPPFVNVFAGDGGPLLANPQTAILSPFAWPRFLFGLDGWAPSAVLILLAAGLGGYWLARELGAEKRAAILSGLFYAGSGFLVVWLLFPIAQVAAFLPSLAAASLRLLRQSKSGISCGLARMAASAQTPNGHPGEGRGPVPSPETTSTERRSSTKAHQCPDRLPGTTCRRGRGPVPSPEANSTDHWNWTNEHLCPDRLPGEGRGPVPSPDPVIFRCTAKDAGLVLLFAALCTAGGHPETLFAGVLGIAAFLLLAVQIVPFLLVLQNSAAAAQRGAAAAPPFRPWAVVSQVLPGALGSPLAGELDLTPLAGAENFNLRAGGYIGALALLAILLACRELAPPLRRGLAVGGAALLLSWQPPLLAGLLGKLPLFGLLHREYLAVVFVLFAAPAAGPALAALAARPRRAIAALLLAIGLAATVAGLLPALPQARPALTEIARAGIETLRERGHLRHPPEVYRARLDTYLEAAGTTTARRLALPGACLALAGLALAWPRLLPRRRELLLGAAALAELAAFGWGYSPSVARTALPAEPEAIAIVKRLDPAGDYLLAANLADFPANLATLYGRRDATSYDLLGGRERAGLLLAAGYDPALHSLTPDPGAEEIAALGRLGVRFVLSRDPVPGATRAPGSPPPALGVYEIPGAALVPRPANRPPDGFAAGLAVSLLAAIGAAAGLLWLRPRPGPPVSSL